MITEPTNEDVLLVDSSGSMKLRSKIAEIMFEKIKVASLNFMNSANLALFSTGRTEGLSLEIGDGLTRVVPVYGVNLLVNQPRG